MLSFLLRRLLVGVPTLVGISLLCFVLLYAVETDPSVIECRSPPAGCGHVVSNSSCNCTQAKLARIRHRLHEDEPYWWQYGWFVYQTASLREPTVQAVLGPMGNTLQLIASAFALEMVLGLLVGFAETLWRRAGRLLAFACLMLVSLPAFLVADFFIAYLVEPRLSFGVADFFRIVPPNEPPAFPGAFHPAWWAHHMLLPSLTMAVGGLAYVALMLRASLGEALRADFVVTARAKGLARRVVVGKHAFRLAALPVVMLLSVDVARLLTADIIAERIFQWNGIADVVLNAVEERDAPTVIVIGMIFALLWVGITALADLAAAALDPRIRLEGR